MATKRERIWLAVTEADDKSRRLRRAIKELDRIAGAWNRTEEDGVIYEESIECLRGYDLPIPDEWLHLAW